MVYLYAALGVVMMTGIMAVVEMGLSLTGQSLLLKPNNPYQQNLLANGVGRRDQKMLSLLQDPAHLSAIDAVVNPAKDLCDKVLDRITIEVDSQCYPGGEYVESQACDDARLLGGLIDADDPQVEKLPNACALEVDSVHHRLLLQRDPDPEDLQIPYRLFSCVLSDAPTCDFESSL